MHATHIEESLGSDSQSAPNTATFAELFKSLRKQLAGKQACLSRAGLRCTDAAISHWERGLRLPRPKTLRNAVRVMTELGAAPDDIARLVSAWNTEYDRKHVARDRPSPQATARAYGGRTSRPPDSAGAIRY